MQVGVAQNEDDTYYFMLGKWQVIATENKVISIEKLELDVDRTYPSVASMKADTELTDGQLVQTEGYWDKQYAGGAYYDIVNSTSLTVDEGKCIQLDNGLYAELHVVNDTVTVNQFGAYGDGEHNDEKAINLSVNSNASNILFESERYKINRRIDIISSNKTIIGNNTTIFYDNDFVFVDDFIIGIFNKEGAIIDNILIQNLSLINNNTTKAEEILMLKVIGAENIEVYKCNLESYNVEGNNDRRVTNIDLRKYWKNITIDGCNLINTTYGPAGGTIWIRAGEEGTGNLIIKNNYIKKSCHDETIAIFGAGVVDDVIIENNTIDFDDRNVKVKSNPVMMFGLNTNGIKNIKLLNNKIKIIANGTFIDVDNADNVLISNNVFDILSLAHVSVSYFGKDNNSRNVKFLNNNVKLQHDEMCDDEIFNNIDEVSNNNIELNTNFIFLCANALKFSNNIVNINETLIGDYRVIYRIRSTTLNEDAIFSDNKIYFNKQQNKDVSIRITSLDHSYMNNFSLYILNNSIYGGEEQESNRRYYCYTQSMKDTTSQNIYLKNNNFGIFTKKGTYESLTNYNFIEK